jgi:formylglycine-generating enzyme required for sulfatase activity
MRLAACLAAACLAACSPDVADGGGASPVGDGLGDAARSTRATWQIVDLASSTIMTAADLPGLAGDPAYRDRLIAFRRIEGPSRLGQPDGSFARQADEDSIGIELPPFYIAACELTRAQWRRIAGTEPWASSLPAVPGGDDLPATGMSFATATSVLADWNLGHAVHLALPGPRQWESAARGGTRTTFPWGEVHSAAVVGQHAVTWGTGGGSGPLAVMGRLANPAGIFDACGNVWEYSSDGRIHGGS